MQLPIQTAPTKAEGASAELVLFDLDHTLLDGDSNELWLEHLVDQGLVAPSILQTQARYFAQYQARELNIEDYLRFHLSVFMRRPWSAWQEVLHQWIEQRILPRIPAKGLQSLESHRAQGQKIAIITATQSLLSGAIGQRLNVDVLATQPRIQNDQILGDWEGIPCFQQTKLDYLKQWLLNQGLEGLDWASVRFYSDSANDLPLLLAVGQPVAVNPDPTLAEQARQRGWPIETWLR